MMLITFPDYWTYGDHVFPDAVNMGAYGPVSESTVARYVSKYGEGQESCQERQSIDRWYGLWSWDDQNGH